MATSIQISKEQIADFCRRHHIRRLSLFGSVLTDHFRPDSDVDVPVEFEEGHIPGMVPVKTGSNTFDFISLSFNEICHAQSFQYNCVRQLSEKSRAA